MQFKLFVGVVVVFGLGYSSQSWGGTVQCFEFVNEGLDDPTRLPPEHQVPLNYEVETNRWCYLNQKETTLVFQFNDQKIKTELVALVETNGGQIFLSHASIVKGKLIYSKTVYFGVSPFGIPLEVSAAKELSLLSAIFLDSSSIEGLNEIHSRLSNQLVSHSIYKIKAGVEKVYLPEEKQPFRGYWWPHKNLPLSKTINSPLGKYDQMVEARSGQNPNSREWESSNHALQNVEWGGHCNGWAASSVLYPDLKSNKFDAKTGLTLTISDLRGMMAETSFCVNWAFYGRRNYGRSTDDPKDIHAHRFHKVLVYYIKHIGKPVAFDYKTDLDVDNNVISGYKFNIKKLSENQFDVVAMLKVHNYDSWRFGIPGIANYYTATYKYTLQTNSQGEIVSGEWISGNPDFLWVPLSQSKCGRENPRMHHKYVEEFMRLPDAPAEEDFMRLPNEPFEQDLLNQ